MYMNIYIYKFLHRSLHKYKLRLSMHMYTPMHTLALHLRLSSPRLLSNRLLTTFEHDVGKDKITFLTSF